ncbi:MAG TPA: cytochrome c [Azospira sp.]|nr:cytochrome c [Azospira sp.]
MRPKLKRYLLAAALLFSLGAAAQGYQIPKPSAGLMPNPATGKTLFEKHCAACHGIDLKGSDRGEKKGPPLLHKIYEPSHHGDAAFQLAAKNGVVAHHWQFGDMAPVPQVTPDDVAHITAYVRAEQRKAGIR